MSGQAGRDLDSPSRRGTTSHPPAPISAHPSRDSAAARPPLPSALLDQIRAGYLTAKQRKKRVAAVLAMSSARPKSTTLSQMNSSAATVTALHQAWVDLSPYSARYAALVKAANKVGAECTDVWRLKLLSSELKAYDNALIVHRPCSCHAGRRADPLCAWFFGKTLLSSGTSRALRACFQDDDVGQCELVCAVIMKMARIGRRAVALCSAAQMLDQTTIPADLLLVDVLQGLFNDTVVPDIVFQSVFDLVVSGGYPEQVGALLFCTSRASFSTAGSDLLARFLEHMGTPASAWLHYCCTAIPWQVYLAQGMERLFAAEENQAMNPFANLLTNWADLGAANGVAPSCLHRLWTYMDLVLVIQYRWITGAVGSEPTGQQLCNHVMMMAKALKAVHRWDIYAAWIFYSTLDQLIVRLAADFDLLRACTAGHPLFDNILALCTAVDEFIFFLPLSYEDETQACKLWTDTLRRARRQERRERQVDEDSMDDADAVQKATSPSRHLQRKPSKPPVTECLAELGEFDFRATQRKVGLHLDPGNGQSLDLILATSLLRLITRVRDELLPTMAVSDYSDSKRTNPYSGLREEVRYLEHVIHFLENVHVRNDKAALSTIISRRLFESGRTFKGFTVTDKKQWDQYVQGQIEGQLLKEQRRSASLRKPASLYSFQVMCNLNAAKADWAELHLECENFPLHTHTIGDYQPETHTGRNSNDLKPVLLNRRTNTSRNLDPQEPSSNVPTIIRNPQDRVHPPSDCVCRAMLWYKGRDVADIQFAKLLTRLYIVVQPDTANSNAAGADNGQGDQGGTTAEIPFLETTRLLNVRRQHQAKFPYLCTAMFEGGKISEYLFKTSRERSAFVMMCSEFCPGLVVVEPVPAAVRKPSPPNPAACDLCFKTFNLFNKRRTCRICSRAVCKSCLDKVDAIEFGAAIGTTIAMCHVCLKARDHYASRSWPARVALEKSIVDKYQEAFRLTMESFRNDIERHAVAVRIQLPIAPVRPKARRKQIVQRNTSERSLPPSLKSMPSAKGMSLLNADGGSPLPTNILPSLQLFSITSRSSVSSAASGASAMTPAGSPSTASGPAHEQDASSASIRRPLMFKSRKLVASQASKASLFADDAESGKSQLERTVSDLHDTIT